MAMRVHLGVANRLLNYRVVLGRALGESPVFLRPIDFLRVGEMRRSLLRPSVYLTPKRIAPRLRFRITAVSAPSLV
jgi:hypothetical protein